MKKRSYDVFPCSNGNADIIVSETIPFNQLPLLRLRKKLTIIHATIPLIHNHMATRFNDCIFYLIGLYHIKRLTIKKCFVQCILFPDVGYYHFIDVKVNCEECTRLFSDKINLLILNIYQCNINSVTHCIVMLSECDKTVDY